MGSVEDSFCLKWNDFHTSVTSSFADLRNEADLFDVTLICEGKPIMAHKLILSACSIVFKQMLRTAKNARDPTILLWDIRQEDMEALLNFMYHGEVNITQEKLNHFLDLAERLQVRGLTSSGEKEKPARGGTTGARKQQHPPLPTRPCTSTSLLSAAAIPPPLKRSKPLNDIVKEEIDAMSSTSSSFTPPVVAEMQHSNDGGGDFHSESQLDSSFMDDSEHGSDDERGGLPPLPQFVHDSLSLQLNDIEPVVAPDGTKEFPCQYCEKRYLTRSRLKRHVLDVHEKGEYACPDCGKIFTSTRRLKDHQRSRYCHGQVRVLIS